MTALSRHSRRLASAAGLIAVLLAATAATPPAGASPATPSSPSSPWTIQPSPSPSGSTGSSLAAVSCWAIGGCMAVGSTTTGGSDQTSLAEVLHRSTWAIVSTPPVPMAADVLLVSVSCADRDHCAAVGYTVSSANSTVRPLAEAWNGTLWTRTPLPLPIGATWATLAGVSCPAADDCTAVGGYIRNQLNGEEKPLAEQWNGSAWSVLAAPNPQAENGSSFSGVDCSVVGSCEVVGDYDYGDVGQSVFAYGDDGTTWTSQTQANPLGQEYNSDNGVSCADADHCAAVGSWTNEGLLGLAQYWDGSGWFRQSAKDPAGSATGELNAVSCVTATVCTAVGDFSDNLNDVHTAPMAEVLDGPAWTQVATDDPAGASRLLSGVSCRAPDTCVAVGASYSSKMGTTLVEVSSSPSGDRRALSG